MNKLVRLFTITALLASLVIVAGAQGGYAEGTEIRPAAMESLCAALR